MPNAQKEVQTKLMKGLLDLIVLQLLSQQPMHGYQIITKIRKSFGVYFGPSTIYPLLGSLEKKGHVSSVWNMDTERPRKVYKLTSEGQSLLNFTEESLNLICRRISMGGGTEVTLATSTRAALKPFMRNSD
jgi:PadR family transcriptional regulator PadR